MDVETISFAFLMIARLAPSCSRDAEGGARADHTTESFGRNGMLKLAIVFVAGGMVGYGIGSVVSKTRRDRMRK
jgi:F0F1-type ATP synthase assembly protein I